MNILLLGSGGREHAIAWKLKQSEQCEQLYIAPGNAGTAEEGTNLELSLSDFDQIARTIVEKEINMLIVGPEAPLVDGITDYFREQEAFAELKIIGPSKKASMLEGSKAFAKRFMAKYSIPTASYKEFDKSNFDEGIRYLENHSMPVVLKADGLAAGKGVIIAQSTEEALQEFTAMIQNEKFGSASTKVVVEDFLDGIEMSCFILTDGSSYVQLPSAKDYKRIGEGDTGLNTGGMGALSPVPFADTSFMKKVKQQVIEPTMRGLRDEKFDYVGFVFFGLIKVDDEPFVIEYNCRLGDPETEVLMPRIKSDLLELLSLSAQKKLQDATCEFHDESCATVMLVSGGYPEAYEKGKIITEIEKAEGSIIFHAGTKKKADQTLTNGGRVIAVSTLGKDLDACVKQSLENASLIQFDGKNYRGDIGHEFIS